MTLQTITKDFGMHMYISTTVAECAKPPSTSAESQKDARVAPFNHPARASGYISWSISSGRVAAGYPLLRGYLSQKSSGLSLALPHFSFVILQLVQVGAESLSNWERASANGIAPFLLHLLAGHNLLLPAAVEMCL